MQAASSADKCALKGTTSFYDGDSDALQPARGVHHGSSRREKGRKEEEEEGIYIAIP